MGVLTTSGILLKAYAEIIKKKNKEKLDLIKFGFTTYEKVLTNLQSAMRGGEFDYKKFISEMKLLDQEIIDLSPSLSQKFDKKVY